MPIVIRMDQRTIRAAHRLKTAADRQGISIRQLSETTGVGFGTVQGIMTGAREPKLSHLYLLADALGIKVSDIITARATSAEAVAS